MHNHFFFSVEQFNHSLDVTFVENALVDLLVRASDEQLAQSGMKKGAMQLVDSVKQQAVLNKMGDMSPEVELGGSASNAARGMAILGAKTSYSSCINQDKYGEMFINRLNDLGIINRLSFCPKKTPTGTCLVVVTPDKERTMDTFLGACQSYTQNDLPFIDIKRSKIFFSTGYMLDTQNQINALHAAIDYANMNNVKVAFDVADAFVIQRHGKRAILDLIQKTHLVFANSSEAQMLLGCQGEKAAQLLSQYVQIAVIKDGANGAYIAHDEKVTYVPPKSVEVADTTGAGDMYAAGFMYGLCRGFDLDYCGKVATIMAADTITHLGVRLSPGVALEIEDLLSHGTKP